MENIRSFALVIVDDFDQEIDRFNLDYADTPKNLGFELDFTTLETKLTTYFTGAREKKLPVTLNLNFLPPNAYQKVNEFKKFVQKYTTSRMVFEYNDTTTEIKNWEGKIKKLVQEELTDWGGLVCPITFIPGTPKYEKKENTIIISQSSVGKSYSYSYPYTYGRSLLENNIITNDYFDDFPLRIILHGYMTYPEIRLVDANTGEVYSKLKFNHIIREDCYVVIDAIQSKVTYYSYDNGVYYPVTAYEYILKEQGYSSFLYAKADCVSALQIELNPSEDGYLVASYRQYTL